jgi:hypothetical protein
MKNYLKNLRQEYVDLNDSFKKQLIFPLTNRGFYSEINLMALAVLYCLNSKISFKIYTKKWVSGNWSDFFNPVIEEYKGLIPIPAHNVFKINRREIPLYIYHKNIKKRIILQGDIWNKMRTKDFFEKHFVIPELDIEGDIFSAKKRIIDIILDYNEETSKNAFSLEKNVSDFVTHSFGMHIRRGDKVSGTSKEADAIDIHAYISKARSIDSNINSFTICTDDYSVIEEFRANYPDFKFLTFCSESKTGYSQKKYNAIKSSDQKTEEVISILKDMHLLKESKLFIGANSSSVSRFVTLVRNNNNCYSLDKSWYPD